MTSDVDDIRGRGDRSHSQTRQHSLAFSEIARSAWRHRDLILQLSRREVLGRYRGSYLGVVWSLVQPIVMLVVYTFVFSVVFRTRWGQGTEESRLDFAIILFTGMIAFGIFGECVNRAPGLVLAQPNYVKKVVFPLEVLPWTVMLSALFHAAVSLVVLVGLFAVSHGHVNWTVLLIPVVLTPLVFLCMGLMWFLSGLGVYVRDTAQVVGVLVTALMFLSPLFYPSSALPQAFQWLVMINPLAMPIEQLREVVVWGHLPDWGSIAAYGVVSLVIMAAGFAWFQRARNGFADVI